MLHLKNHKICVTLLLELYSTKHPDKERLLQMKKILPITALLVLAIMLPLQLSAQNLPGTKKEVLWTINELFGFSDNIKERIAKELKDQGYDAQKDYDAYGPQYNKLLAKYMGGAVKLFDLRVGNQSMNPSDRPVGPWAELFDASDRIVLRNTATNENIIDVTLGDLLNNKNITKEIKNNGISYRINLKTDQSNFGSDELMRSLLEIKVL